MNEADAAAGTGPVVPVGRAATRRMSWLLAGLTALALAAALILPALNVSQLDPAVPAVEVILAAAVLLYTGTGRLITRRVPGNAIGWLLALIGLFLAGEILTEQYALYGLVSAPGALPAIKVTGWFSVILAALAIFALLFLLLL